MSFLTAHSAGETVGPEDTPGGKGALVSPQILTVPEAKAFPSNYLLFLYAPPPPPDFLDLPTPLILTTQISTSFGKMSNF